MKKLLLPFLFIAFSTNAQEKEMITLKWKLTDTLSYKTFMYGYTLEEKIKKAETETNIERKNKLLKEIERNKLNYETLILPDSKGNFDVKMILKATKADSVETYISKMAKLNKNVVLRGKFTPEGKILSFYYEQNKKNLISLLFELPQKSVKIGDEWNIDVDMISLDQHFKADSLHKKNTVRLKDIVERNGNKIAIIEYDLNEYVSGSLMKKKSLNSKQNELSEKPYLKAIHKIIGEFNIDKGFWISYNGYRETKGNISIWGMNNNKKSVLKLILKK
ncbi:hypothetical protein [Bizionia paragorgiae]|uniref:Uncharacterized protein n=1 Tax=Bizionia paragorgiae TaxID=283786 RepID=A0A1H4BY73_BIZPA|nr:hypothetical protein [Bizionia paragorgiae]SEA53131.1 hypothetical protein SAMN04487990_1175 [Bizionia paragorgiae]